MTSNNDIDLPPEPLLPTLYTEDQDLIPQQIRQLKDDCNPLNLEEEDVEETIKDKVHRRAFVANMADCDMWLHNINKTFKFATSVRSVISLVGAGITIHRHRQALMKDASGVKEGSGDTIEFDNMGNIIARR